MKKVKKLISIFLSIAMIVVIYPYSCINANAADDIYNDGVWQYTIDGDHAVLVGVTEVQSGESCGPPSVLGGYPLKVISGVNCGAVAGIRSNQFIIPKGVESIKGQAFNTSEFTSVVMPLSLKEIGFNAFPNCYSFNTVFYEGSVEDWEKISISYPGLSNEWSINANKHYNYVYQRANAGVVGAKIEAENTIITNGNPYWAEETASNGYCVDFGYNHNFDLYFEFVVTEAGYFKIFENAFWNDRYFSLYIDDVLEGTYLATGPAERIGSDFEITEVYLDRGKHKIKFYNENPCAPVYDYFYITFIGNSNGYIINGENFIDQDFVNNQSSEYSYLMAESWKNAGMENINQYLMTFPSISKAILDSCNSNQEFLDSVSAWKTMNLVFEPGQLIDDALSMKDYYSAILLSLIDSEILNDNYVKSIEKSSKFEYVKLYNQFSKIIKSCDEIDHDKLLSTGTCSIEDITILNNKINSLDGISGKISNISNFLSTGKTINESINLCINYYNVCNASKCVVNVLKRMRSNASNNRFLCWAIDDITHASENAFDYVASGFLSGTVNAAKDFGVGKINDAWQSLLNSNVVTKGALLGYKVGKPLSNMLFSTDCIISNYFEFTALHEVEKALKTTIKDFEMDFYSQIGVDSSLNYINAVSLYFKTYYLSCDYAIELAKYKNLCPFAYIFYNGKKGFDEANKQFNEIRLELKAYEDQLFRLWSYSLKDRYPDIYSEIAPSLGDVYSNDLSTATVRLEYLAKTYTGEALKPGVTVVMGSAILSTKEYSVIYADNIEPGIATVKITAATNSIYIGEKTVEFIIKESPFVKRLSIRGAVPQISMFSLSAVSEDNQKNSGIGLPDVYFYEDNKVVASVENGVITNDELPIYITENGIDTLMQNKNYTVEIRGSSKQIYNTEIQKLDEELLAIEKSNYNNLSLSMGISCNINTDTPDEVIANNEVLQPNFSTETSGYVQQYNIYSDQCLVNNSAYKGQRVYISAIIPKGYIFVGWSVSPQVLLSSNSSVSSFIMPDRDVEVVAVLIENNFTISGDVDSYGDSSIPIKLQLFDHEEKIAEINTTKGIYAFKNINPGTYILKVSKVSHVTRTYQVTVFDSDVTQDVEIHLIGDISGDGKVNNRDLTRLFQHLSGWNVEVNEAAFDVNGDGKVNNRDLTRLFQYLSGWDVEIK